MTHRRAAWKIVVETPEYLPQPDVLFLNVLLAERSFGEMRR
jgi:hypothetical protein